MGLRDLFNRDRDESSSSISPPRVERPPSSLQRGSCAWVPAGGDVVVDGRRIDGGMLYVGTQAPSADGFVVEPALVDPSLKVAWNAPDHAGDHMGYWPAYNAIDPRSRAAYLAWLADGRQHPTAYIGYVFLFFYGLERRLLFDLVADLAGTEATELVAEVRRLRSIYGANHSFARYSTDLLEFVDTSRLAAGPIDPPAWPPDTRDWRVPVAIRVALGRYVAAGQPIPAVWALSFLRHHPEAYLRTPAQRCVSEFDELFKVRYRERFDDGLKVRPPASRLSADYQAASGGISRPVKLRLEVPDVTSIAGPINKLKDLAFGVTDELDAYSRFIGRRADEAGTPAAIALLPDELVASHGGGVVASLRTWTDARLGDSAMVPIDFSDLIAQWTPGAAERFAKRDAVALASMLAKLGVGIEPDVRFGAPTPKPGSRAVLFRLPAQSTSAPSPSYTAAMSLVHLTAVVAASDGSITDAEQKHLAEHAEHVLGLDHGECARLEAHLAFLSQGRVSIAGVKRKVDGLPLEQRSTVGRFLIDVAAADGVVSPAEISTLTKVFAHLGLDEASVFSQVHALESGDTGPITVREGDRTQRWGVPPGGPERQSSGVVLDQAKVQARLAETAHVAALLTDIFANDADDVAVPPALGSAHLPPPSGSPVDLPPPPVASPGLNVTHEEVHVAGLDGPHSQLARRLAQRPSWDRSDVEDAAAQFGITFLDAAVDRINDAAFEVCGEPLIEGDDPVELNVFAVEEMLS